MTIDEAIHVIALITLVVMMVSMGLSVTLAQVTQATANWRLVMQGLVANYVVVPAVALALLILLHPEPLVATGFLVVAACRGATFGPPYTMIAKGNVALAVRLMVLLAGSSAVITPMLLHLLLPWVTGDASLNIDIGKIIGTLLLGQVAPLALGLFVVERRPALAAKLKKPFERATSVLTLTYIVLILASQSSMLAHVRLRGSAGMMTLWAAAATVGWLAGAPGRDNRSAMTLTTAERNDGLAMVIVTGNFAGTPAVPATMIYGLVEMLATLLVALGLRQWAPRKGSIAVATAWRSAMRLH